MNDRLSELIPQATIKKLQHVLPTDPEDNLPHYDEDIELISQGHINEPTPTITNFDSNCTPFNDQSVHKTTPTISRFDSTLAPQYKTTQPNTQTGINPLSIEILTNNGQVNTNELHALQEQILQPTPNAYFIPHRQQFFHIDTGAIVHATNNKSNFLIFYQHRRSVNIAAGQSAKSEGYGIIMAQLIPSQLPLPLAPVYYCPHTTTGTLSPQCL